MIQTEIGLNANPFKRGVEQARAAMRRLPDEAKVQSRMLEDQFRVINIFRAGAVGFGVQAIRSFFQTAIADAKEMDAALSSNVAAAQRFGNTLEGLTGAIKRGRVEAVGFLNQLGEAYGDFISIVTGGATLEQIIERRKQEKELVNLAKQQSEEAAARKKREEEMLVIQQDIERMQKSADEARKTREKGMLTVQQDIQQQQESADKARQEREKRMLELQQEIAESRKRSAELAERIARAEQAAADSIRDAMRARQEGVGGMVGMTPREIRERERAEREVRRTGQRLRRILRRAGTASEFVTDTGEDAARAAFAGASARLARLQEQDASLSAVINDATILPAMQKDLSRIADDMRKTREALEAVATQNNEE